MTATATALLDRLGTMHITVSTDGEQLVLDGNAQILTEELVREVREAKTALLAVLAPVSDLACSTHGVSTADTERWWLVAEARQATVGVCRCCTAPCPVELDGYGIGWGELLCRYCD